MSGNDRRSVLESSDGHPFCRKVAAIQLSFQGRVDNYGNDDGSAPSPSGVAFKQFSFCAGQCNLVP